MIEVIALAIVVLSFVMFGVYGIIGLLAILLLWQVRYRIKTGHWMQGVDHW